MWSPFSCSDSTSDTSLYVQVFHCSFPLCCLLWLCASKQMFWTNPIYSICFLNISRWSVIPFILESRNTVFMSWSCIQLVCPEIIRKSRSFYYQLFAVEVLIISFLRSLSLLLFNTCISAFACTHCSLSLSHSYIACIYRHVWIVAPWFGFLHLGHAGDYQRTGCKLISVASNTWSTNHGPCKVNSFTSF